MLHCKHFDSAEGVLWCTICLGVVKVKVTPSREVQLMQQSARIDAGEGYWSNEAIKRRQKSEMVPCTSCAGEGEHFAEQRMCYGCQERQLQDNARAIRGWMLRLHVSSEDSDTKEMASFSAALAGDRSARITHSGWNGLYPDDPPLSASVPES